MNLSDELKKNKKNFDAVTLFILIMIIGRISGWVMEISSQPFLR